MEYISKLCELAGPYIEKGELFVLNGKKSMIVLQDGEINEIDMTEEEGLGLRNIDEKGNVYFASSSDISLKYMKNILIPNIEMFVNRKKSIPSIKGLCERSFYPNTLDELPITQRIEILKEINSYLRQKSNIIKNITIRESCSYSDIYIYSSRGLVYDQRPLFSLSIVAIIEKKDSQLDSVHVSFSRRHFYSELIGNWQSLCDELIRKASVIAEAIPFSGGNMSVILGPGIPATLLHEAVGHGLEADFIHKQTSVFNGKMNQKIASDLVTVIDDGTIPCSRGTINFDDEGTPTQRTILIENGILVNYMYDKVSAIKMNTKSTGNGRRQYYSSQPMPRMTNTIMLEGKTDIKDMISSIKHGIIAMDFGTGQVDISSGQFSFNGSEAYKITNGIIDYPISKCSISGMGSDVMKSIIAVGNDFKMDPSGGTCGKNGQSVPVNLGQPSVLVSNMIVG